MSATSRACPKCFGAITVPASATETVTCQLCGATIKLTRSARPVTSAAGAVPVATLAKPAAGKLVAGLQVQDELARGGLGVVYLAYHPLLKDFRAIKRPLANAGLEREVVLARFRREVEALGTLHSKHIVRAHDAGADDEGPFLVTEYLDGEPLSRLLERHRRLPVPEACELIRQAALGLQAAHESGLVHRDIKLSNLVLARDGPSSARMVIVDWGLVKQAGHAEVTGARLTSVHMQMGTPDFISPEQIRDAHKVDIRSDIYSLGVTLYCLLAGQPPFHNRPDEQKVTAQLREEFPALAALRPDVPTPFLQVLAHMVRKDPAQRYQTPAQVAEALQRFCAGEARLLLALLAPVPAGRAAHVETKDAGEHDTNVTPSKGRPSTEETLLAPARGAVATPAAGPRKRGCVIAAVAGVLVSALGVLLVVVLVVAAVLRKTDDAGSNSEAKDKSATTAKDGKETTPTPADVAFRPLKEDFRAAWEKKQFLPKGWEGDAYRVGIDKGEPCLELSKLDGVNWVTLPSMNISGDFSIAGVYFLHPHWQYGQTMTFRLESSKGGPPLLIVITWEGHVTIHDQLNRAPAGFGAGHDFLITREGKRVSVRLNGTSVGTRGDLPAAPDYDIVKLNLTPGAGGGKLYRLTIQPGADFQPPPVAKDAKGKKK